jgi:hypothetical protein
LPTQFPKKIELLGYTGGQVVVAAGEDRGFEAERPLAAG